MANLTYSQFSSYVAQLQKAAKLGNMAYLTHSQSCSSWTQLYHAGRMRIYVLSGSHSKGTAHNYLILHFQSFAALFVIELKIFVKKGRKYLELLLKRLYL